MKSIFGLFSLLSERNLDTDVYMMQNILQRDALGAVGKGQAASGVNLHKFNISPKQSSDYSAPVNQRQEVS